MKQHTLQPKLRFPEFEEDWKKEFIKNISDFIGGGTPDTSKSEFWQGNIPWISSSDIFENEISKISLTRFINLDALNNSATKLIPKGSLLIVSRVGVGKFAIAPTDICTSQDFTNLILKKDEVNNAFLAYQLFANKNVLLKISQGTSIKGFTSSDLKSVLVQLPSLPEQQKIADYLSTIDKKITLLEEKKEELARYKKAMMQKLFSQEIRFKDDNGNDFADWEAFQLKDILIEHKEKNKGDKYDEVLSVAKMKGVINQIEHLGRSYSAEKIDHYKVINPFDIVYTKSPTSGFPFGIIKQNKLNRSGVLSPLYAVFKPKTIYIGMILHDIFLSEVETYNYLVPLVQKGAKNTMNINNDEFLKGKKYSLPTSELEQQKIAEFLSAIDESIDKVSEQITQTQSFKKAMLQQMFV